MPTDAPPAEAECAAAGGFAPGTLILTARGELPVERLSVGDLIATAEHGLQPVRRIDVHKLRPDAAAPAASRPIEIKQGALGLLLPRRRLIVAPGQLLLLSGAAIEEEFDAPEVIGPAAGLITRERVRRMNGKRRMTCYAPVLDQLAVIYAEGTPVAVGQSAEAQGTEAPLLAPVAALTRLCTAGRGPLLSEATARSAEFALWNADRAAEIGLDAAEALEAERAAWRAAVGPPPSGSGTERDRRAA